MVSQLPLKASARASASSNSAGDVSESPALGHLRGSLVQLVRFAALAVDIPVRRLQAQTEILFGLARKPLDLFGDALRIVSRVGHFEVTLMDPRRVDSLRPQFLG